MRLNPVDGGAIGAELTATTRTGMARFTFPRNPHSSVLINAGGSAQPDDFAAVQVDPARREIDGTASSGLFCGQRPRYRVYIAAVFNRRFDAYGTWEGNKASAGSSAASDSQKPAANPATTADAGAFATFDTRRNRVVVARVGVSFVSVEDARANLAAENPGLGFGEVAKRAEGDWNRSLGRIRVDGGPRRLLDTFYTALYHVFLAPRTFSDVGGAYIGMDGLVHRARGRIQYADFSGWDTYRTQIQLLSILAPRRASEMVRSLLADAAESGCLPRWPYANGQSMTMVGDSADPLIASAAAFGATAFDRRAALAAMLRGADEPCRSANGEYLERQGLAAYLALGYVPYDLDTNVRNANSIYGSPDDVWGSAATSLEYAVDDFAIAQFAARALRDRATYRRFMQRSGNWRKLFDRSERHDRAALRKWRLSSQLRQPRAAAASSRATPPSTPGWCRTTRPASSAGWGAAVKRLRAARPLPAQAQRRRRGHPHRPRPARQRADAARALALRLDATPLRDPGGGPARAPPLQHRPGRLPRQRRPRHALLLVRVRGPRPLPGGARGRPAGDRQPAVRTRLDRASASPARDDLCQLPTRSGARGTRGTASDQRLAGSRSARRPRPTFARCSSTAVPTGSRGPPTAPWPGARISPSSSARTRTATGAASAAALPPSFGPHRRMPRNACTP